MRRNTSGLRHDYKDNVVAAPDRKRRRWQLFALGVALPLIGVAILSLAMPKRLLPPQPAESSLAPPPQATNPAIPPLDELAATTPSLDAPTGTLLDLLVKRGDTLEILFRQNGLSLNDLAAMIALPDAAQALKLLKPGDRLEIAHREGEVMSLQRELDEVKLLSIVRRDSGFAVNTIERPVDIRTSGAHGTIRSSLFEAGTAAGMTDRMTMDMAGIFEWDIDFIQDVRGGDQFTVIFEEIWRDGVKLRDGAIVAAEFVNQGKSYRAVRFSADSGRRSYYTPEGRSLRKAFIRAPLNFTRISSPFNPNRRHPLLNTIRAHRGVDYAAPTGTPVRAAGDGKILFRGVQGGYGNTIVLQHGSNITTLYGHLSRFGAPRVGARVNQGEVIGYVGMTGLATGPHLHYEYRVNGVHRNPRTVPLPPAEPVPTNQQDAFRAETEAVWRQLEAFPQHDDVTARMDAASSTGQAELR